MNFPVIVSRVLLLLSLFAWTGCSEGEKLPLDQVSAQVENIVPAVGRYVPGERRLLISEIEGVIYVLSIILTAASRPSLSIPA